MDKDERRILELLKNRQLGRQQALDLLLRRQNKQGESFPEKASGASSDRNDWLRPDEAEPPRPDSSRPAPRSPMEQGLSSVALEALEQDLTRLVSQQLKVDPTVLDPETNLNEYGFDSISLGEFSSILNERYQLDLTPGDLVEHSTLAQ